MSTAANINHISVQRVYRTGNVGTRIRLAEYSSHIRDAVLADIAATGHSYNQIVIGGDCYWYAHETPWFSGKR
jgi:hypothetical protein